MEIEIRKGNYAGRVHAPPSKSAAHRLLICAGLADGVSTVRGVSESEDMKATLDCLCALGAEWRREGDTVTVRGCDPFRRGRAILPCRESGSTLRFFLPLCLLSEEEAILTGSPTLLSRPLSVYGEICAGQGLPFFCGEDGVRVAGRLSSGFFRLAGDISSQFVTGLLFTLPLLPGFSVIELIPPIVSRPYLDMTIEALSAFGVQVEMTENRILIPGGQRVRATEATAEGDWSNAAFFLAMAALGHEVSVDGLRRETLQGDAVIDRLLGRMMRSRPTICVEDCPDLAPILMATAAAANGCCLTGTSRLKIKESDRGQAMAEELSAFGASVTVEEDRIVVEPPKTLRAPDRPLRGHNDHRIVMACAVLLTLTGGRIEGAEAVRKSYPDFFRDLFSLCGESISDAKGDDHEA